MLNRSTLPINGTREDAVADTHPPGRPIQGVREVTATLTALVRSARRELLIFDDPGSCLGQCIPEQFLEFAGACVRAAGDQSWPDGGPGGLGGRGRGRPPSVGVRRIVPRHGLAALPHPLPRQLPGRARQTDSIPFKMILVDRSVAAVPLDLQLHFHGLLLIRDPVVVQALVRTHESWWETGEELPTATVPAPGVLPVALRPVLEALLAGLTDEAAATRLGMSSRTYSRRVGDLMAALGTTSRFRAGAEAARRGWI
ncbi:DNA-binding response regulator [Streptomyces sp. NPDC088554]|uniref:helix-turn-helix transcriptional regulator n=1 Tax=Streptomyces sp. NPDC088554 TaxID=3365865 RepID=UPI0037F23D4F